MSRHWLSRFETSQFRLRASKTTKCPTINQENISIFDNSNDLDLDDIEYNDEFCDGIENDNEFGDDIEYDNEIYNTNSDNSTSEDETTFVDISEIFDETNFNITWDPEDQFGIFGNFTTMAMFMWAVKYMISKTAYHDLIQILLHPQFDKNHLYLHRILKNPNISSHLYFGPEILSESCEELCERNLWTESPLFGQSQITTSQ
ncbi:hypothetical protein F8M41_015070, partial [Gigaspora margarita]